MSRGLVIAAVAITGCGAAPATPTVEPEPGLSESKPGPCGSEPGGPRASSAEQSSAGPRCPEPASCPDCPVSAFELQAVMGGTGFWCWRRTAGALITEGECFRLEAACNGWRESAIKHGNAPTECTRSDRAVCFDLVDRRKQKILFRCMFTPEECESFRAEFVEKFPEYHPGECRPTT